MMAKEHKFQWRRQRRMIKYDDGKKAELLVMTAEA